MSGTQNAPDRIERSFAVKDLGYELGQTRTISAAMQRIRMQTLRKLSVQKTKRVNIGLFALNSAWRNSSVSFSISRTVTFGFSGEVNLNVSAARVAVRWLANAEIRFSVSE